jgi:hypothetical protein
MRRGGNYQHTIQTTGATFVVHRGVSQAKRPTEAQTLRLWKKRNKEVEGVTISEHEVRITPAGLRSLRERSLVIISNPASPQVWSPGRIAGKKSKLI